MTDTESFSASNQVVLILVGLIGSGKSTFAEALQTSFPEFVRCNQDDLGDRRAVEVLARKSLRQGSSVVIDRTNFDASQRAHWIKIAREVPGTLIWILVFDTPKDVCATRLRTRTGHPTIPDPVDALSILDRFSSQYRAPSQDEGYNRILYLHPDEQEIVYSRSTLAAILRRVRDAPPIARSVGPAVSTPSTQSPYYPRGGFARGTRGRGGNRVYAGHRGGRGNASTGGLKGQVVSASSQQSERGRGGNRVYAGHHGGRGNASTGGLKGQVVSASSQQSEMKPTLDLQAETVQDPSSSPSQQAASNAETPAV